MLSLLSSIVSQNLNYTGTVTDPANTNLWLQFENNSNNSGTMSIAPTATLYNTGTLNSTYDSTLKASGGYSLKCLANSPSYLSVPDITFSYKNGATFSIWFYYTSISTAYTFLTGIVPNGNNYYVIDFPTSTTMRFLAGKTPGSTTNYCTMIIDNNTFTNTCGITANKWNHVAWSISGTSNSPYTLGTVSVVINGVSVTWTGGLSSWASSQNTSGNYLTQQTSNDFRLQQTPGYNALGFVGNYDNVRYYNYALSITQMQSIYLSNS